MMQIQKTEKGLFNSARQHLEMSSFVIIRVQKMSTNGKRNAKEKKKSTIMMAYVNVYVNTC